MRIQSMALGFGLFFSACGASERTYTGKIDLAAFGRTQAELVTVRDDGARSSTRVRDDGSFEIELEPGHSHGLAFRSTDRGRTVHFANLVFRTGSGKSGVMRASEGETPFDMGRIEPESEPASDCRGMPDPSTPDPSTPDPSTPAGDPSAPTNPAIALFSSALATSATDDGLHHDADTDDHSNDALADADGDDRPDALDDDDDDDGICNGDDDSTDAPELEPGDDHGGSSGGHGSDDGTPDGGTPGDGTGTTAGSPSLPYDVRLAVGDSFTLGDAFAVRGPAPVEILDVQMDGGSWHLAELRAGTRFTVTQADCDHEGNRGTARDRIFVAWRNADDSQSLEHLDLRYCGR